MALRRCLRPLVNAAVCGRRCLATVRYSERGDPYKVLCVEDDAGKAAQPGQGEVALKMLFSPLNGIDVDQIEGKYSVLPKLPAVAGQEGLGEVTAVGAGVKNLSAGDWVVPVLGSGFAAWQTAVTAAESQLQKVRSDIPAEYASALAVSPSVAYRLLKDFADLKEGDVIIQSASNSAVGTAVLQIAKKMGVKTINVIRNRCGACLYACSIAILFAVL
jgi:mitochondrial enoyl-[acyl-carrier protein] reductase / trans-2-enoyl-CoA reductase